MIKRNSKSLILLGLLMGLSGPLLAQESTLKAYAEEHRDRKFCFYPSTLRMMNLTKNEEFNVMVKPIRKMLIYTLDSASIAEKSYVKLPQQFQKNGYEEYITMYGAGNNMFIYGKESSEEMMGVIGMNDRMFAFYLLGNVNWQKIPTLFTTMQDNEILQIFDLK
jgi:hypothetical protein